MREREREILFKAIVIWVIFLVVATKSIQSCNWFRLTFIKHFSSIYMCQAASWASSQSLSSKILLGDLILNPRLQISIKKKKKKSKDLKEEVTSLSVARNEQVAKPGLKPNLLTPQLLHLPLVMKGRLGPRGQLHGNGITHPSRLGPLCAWPVWGSLWQK